ncbi:MAG: HK97 family phage prohead protease [Rhodospirillaceae bacterium]|nr:HK97 family phage prohead protease [Rhodospirillaceae bacterium]
MVANRQHDRARPLARSGRGLALEDSPEALRAALELPDTVDGREVRTLVELGVLTGFSAEFRTIRDEWPSPTERIIYEAELFGLAVVDDPAHTGAVIEEARARLGGLPPRQRHRRIWL